MEVFISWSKPRSGEVALLLRDWLPKVVNALKPWISSADIAQGTRWSSEVATRLGVARAGIICLTPENLHSDWILFEAGALSKTVDSTYVCPLLIDLDPSQITGPLAQFQLTRFTREGMLKLLRTLNKAIGDAALSSEHLEEAFLIWWPTLESKIRILPKEAAREPERSERDMLKEVLELMREQKRLGAPSPESLRDVRINTIYLIREYIKVIVTEALRESGDDVTLVDQGVSGNNLVYFITSKSGRQFKFAIPRNLREQTDIADQLRTQLSEQL